MKAIGKNNTYAKHNIKNILSDKPDKIIEIMLNLCKNISTLEINNTKLNQEIEHLKYVPGGIGYLEAKYDFEIIANITNNNIK